jgi:hypothetical protein
MLGSAAYADRLGRLATRLSVVPQHPDRREAHDAAPFIYDDLINRLLELERTDTVPPAARVPRPAPVPT